MSSTPKFLRDGGEMGARMRAYDWSSTSLGAPETWPYSLKLAVRMILSAQFAMNILWGDEAISLYNDAYAELIGSLARPSLLGEPAKAIPPGLWDQVIEPQFSQIMQGGPGSRHKNQLISIDRHGVLEDVYWTYSYNPIEDREARNGVGGVLLVAHDTTQEIIGRQKLRSETARQRTNFQEMPGFVALLNGSDHRYEYVNDAYRTLFGAHDYIGRTPREVFTPAEAQGFFDRLDHICATKAAFRGKAHSIRLSNWREERFVDLAYQPLFDDDGTITGIFVGGYDITDRVRAEAMHRAAETRQRFLLTLGDRLREQRTAVDAMQAGVDAVAKFIPVSRVGYSLVEGDQVTAAQQTDATQSFPAPLMTGPLDLFGAGNVVALRAGRTVICNDVERDPGTAGIGLTALGTAALIAVPLVREGRLRAIFYFNHNEPRVWSVDEIDLAEQVATRIWDAVERGRAEEALRQSERRQAFLFDLIWRQRNAVDEEGVLQTAAQALGRHLEVDRAGFFELTDDHTMTFTSCWADGRLPLMDGSWPVGNIGPGVPDQRGGRTLVFSDSRTDPVVAGSIFAEIGAIAGIGVPVIRRGRWSVGLYVNCAEPRNWLPHEIELAQEVAEISWDAVERVRVRAELQEANANLADRIARALSEQALVEDALRQSQKLEAVGQLTGGVAHDFNNLLTVIRSSIDFLKRPNLSEERRIRYISAISETADRAAKLTGQLLAFARRQTLKPEVFDVGHSIQTIRVMVTTLAGSRVNFITEELGEPCFVKADPSQFDTALVNIAVNARDAMDGEGDLILSVRGVFEIPAVRHQPAVPGSFVAVSVRDTGSGIAADHLEKIFEPFFTTKMVGQGTGLGLSQVFGFAKQSGGEVRVESQVGQGATFTLYLPRVPAEAKAVFDQPADPDVFADGQGLCVLVVEDNADVGQFATQALSELGYQTVWAANASEALAELERDARRFDVVFSDVVMPGMNGIELALAIRRNSTDLPVVLTSGYSHVLAENGTFGFELLHKPYSVDQLSRILVKATTARRPVVFETA